MWELRSTPLVCFMGMSFEVEGIRFHPVIPKVYSGIKSLSNFKYRNAVLDILVKGYGNKILSINMDGKPLQNDFLPGSVTGKHRVEIEMKNCLG